MTTDYTKQLARPASILEHYDLTKLYGFTLSYSYIYVTVAAFKVILQLFGITGVLGYVLVN